MSWDFPLLLISAVSLPLIILFHLLSRRRKTILVPSLILWQRLMESERRSLTLRRFVSDALLILQLLAAAALVTGLVGPRLPGGGGRIAGPTVLAIDISASMAAVDGEGMKRFDLARGRAGDLLRGKAGRAEVMLLAAGSEARPLTGFTASRRELIASLDRIELTDEAGDPASALRAARAMAAARSGGRVIFITDGSFDGAAISRAAMRVIQVGESADNTGITAFSVRGYEGGGRELLATVDHFGTKPRDVQLSVELDGRELSRERLNLRPGDRVSRSLSWKDPLAGRVELRLEAEEPDALAGDDGVFAVLSPGGRIRVALITPGNWFLETLLETHPGVSLEVFGGPEAWEGSRGSWDLVIADRIYPTGLPDGSILAIYPFSESPPPLPLEVAGELERLTPTRWDANHPALQGVDLAKVAVASATRLIPEPGARVLADAEGLPLLLAGENHRGRWMAIAFDLLESSLPVRPAFPILMTGALSWLTPGNPDEAASFLKAGEAWTPPPEFAGEPWTLSGPRGRQIRSDSAANRAPTGPRTVGFWTIEGAPGKADLGVNLLHSGESNLAVRLPPGGDSPSETSPAARDASAREATGLRAEPRPLVSLLLSAAVLILAAEWLLQRRQWRQG